MKLRLAGAACSALGLAVLLAVCFATPDVAAADGSGEVAIEFANGDVRLAGTLVLPEGEGPFPAVVLAHGSAAESREPYLVDARMLAQHGIAAFAFDKRGTGVSTGDLEFASIEDLVGDLRAAVGVVAARSEVTVVGVLGVSQGAWLAPFVAADSPEVGFIVQVTGSATSLGAQNLFDGGRHFEQAGFTEQDITRYVRAERLLYSLRGAIDAGWLPLPRYWFVSLDPFAEPAEAWRDVGIPALVLFGGRDDLVPTATSRAILGEGEGLLRHPWSRVVELDGYPHALGGPARNEDARYVELVTGWVSSVAAGTEPSLAESRAPNSGSPAWFVASARPGWWGSGPVQLGLIVLLLASALGLLVAAVRSSGGRGVRLAVGLQALLVFASVAGVVFILQWVLAAEGSEAVPPVPLASVVRPLAAVSAVVAIGLGLVAIRWRGMGRTRALLPGVASIAGLLSAALAAYWELLGTPL